MKRINEDTVEFENDEGIANQWFNDELDRGYNIRRAFYLTRSAARSFGWNVSDEFWTYIQSD